LVGGISIWLGTLKSEEKKGHECAGLFKSREQTQLVKGKDSGYCTTLIDYKERPVGSLALERLMEDAVNS